MLAALVCAVALVACGKQSPTGGGPPPTTDTLQLIPVATTLVWAGRRGRAVRAVGKRRVPAVGVL